MSSFREIQTKSDSMQWSREDEGLQGKFQVKMALNQCTVIAPYLQLFWKCGSEILSLPCLSNRGCEYRIYDDASDEATQIAVKLLVHHQWPAKNDDIATKSAYDRYLSERKPSRASDTCISISANAEKSSATSQSLFLNDLHDVAALQSLLYIQDRGRHLLACSLSVALRQLADILMSI